MLPSMSTCAFTTRPPPVCAQRSCRAGGDTGKAVQVEPMKPLLKAPGAKRLKPKCDKLLSSFAFNFNLRPYNVVVMQELYNLKNAVGTELAAGPGHSFTRPHTACL